MNPWLQKRIATRLTIIRIVWFALTATVGVYGALIAKSNSEVDWNSVLKNPSFVPYAVVSVVTFALSIILPGIFQKTAAKRVMDKPWNEEYLRTAKTSKGQRLYRDEDIPQLLALQGQDLVLERIVQIYFTSKILRWALSESIAIYGFLLGFTMHSLLPFFPFAALGLFGMIISGPGEQDLRQYAGVS